MAIISIQPLVGHSMGLTVADGIKVREALDELTIPIILSFNGITVMTWDFMVEAFKNLIQIQVSDPPPNPQYFEKFLSQKALNSTETMP